MEHILDFCKGCGLLLYPGKGKEKNPTCEKCGDSVRLRKDRLQGVFSEKDAEVLLMLSGYVTDERLNHANF